MSDHDGQSDEAISTCPVCARTYPSGVRFCADDGAALVSGAVSDDRRGRVIGGRYQLGEALGSGGMGVVYDAEQLGVGRRVAVKLLSRERAGRARSRARFLREARTISQLQSPHTVTLIDFGHSEAGEPYLVMERLSGTTLRQALTERGPFEASEVARIIGQIARSLAEAHARGIVHRDLKPENVMLCELPGGEPPHVTVLDFGVARVLEDQEHLTQTSEVPGTPMYLAPELLESAAATACSDVYALGVIAYELLTGKPPFAGSAWEVMAQHREAHPKAFEEHGVTPPLSLTTLIWRMLAKPPALRPLDGSAVLAALRVHAEPAASVATTDEVFGEPPAGPEPTSPRRRHTPRALLTAVALIGLGGIAGYALGGGKPEGPETVETTVAEPSPPEEIPTHAEPIAASEPQADAFAPADATTSADDTDSARVATPLDASAPIVATPAERPPPAVRRTSPPAPASRATDPPPEPIDPERANRIDEMLP